MLTKQKLIHITHSFTAQYIDDFDELPLDVDTLRRHVERFIIVSAPLQLFLADLRRIYTWHDPARTGKWLALYCFLWYISHIMTFVVSTNILTLVIIWLTWSSMGTYSTKPS